MMNLPSIRTFARVVYPVLVLLAAQPAWAELECPAPAPVIPPPENPLPPGAPPRITADRASVVDEGISSLHGSVRLEDPQRTLEANNLYYHRKTDWVQVSGPLRYQDPSIGVRAGSGEYNIQTREGRFNDTKFGVTNNRARGEADSIHTDGQGITRFTEIEYTTCNPGDEDWLLKADRVTIDRGNTTGTARNAVLRFKGVPLFYTPYFSFPVGVDRKTGFLLPRIGTSQKSGLDVAAPYYINIAPNLDATVTPRVLTSRGVQLGSQVRHLGRASESEIGAEYLPDDKRDNRDRYLGHLQHRSLLGDQWALRADYTRVSDDGYFDDLDSSVGASSQTHLEQSARLSYQAPGGWFHFRGLAQDFQTIDRRIATADEPAARLPQLRFDFVAPSHWLLQPGLDTEAVRFARSVGEEGTRVDVQPYLALDYDREAWFARSRLAYRYTAYDIDNRVAGLDDTPTRSIPSASFDTGLRFERSTGGERILTLEPRLFYLYIPYRDQDDLPLFDTTLPDFELGELFSENRFVGSDRIGDANQLTLAVSSNLINPVTGATDIRATLGQIYYFEDPEVLIPGTAPLDPDHSDLVAETRFRLNPDWSAALTGQWDSATDRFDRGSVGVSYRPDNGAVVNAAYRFRRQLLEQTDLSFILPLSARWKFIGRWNHSLRDDRDLETLAGFEYGSCCWAVRTAWRRNVTSTGDYNTGVYLQLELKGLGNFGHDLEDLLERRARDYIPN